jgi:hypothetical protein
MYFYSIKHAKNMYLTEKSPKIERYVILTLIKTYLLISLKILSYYRVTELTVVSK